MSSLSRPWMHANASTFTPIPFWGPVTAYPGRVSDSLPLGTHLHLSNIVLESRQGLSRRFPGAKQFARAMPVAAFSTTSTTLTVLPGTTEPPGPSPVDNGVNFALAAPNATSVTLCVYSRVGNLMAELPMQRDGDSGVWHGLVPGLPLSEVLYGYKVAGNGGWETPFRWDASRVLLDPWAPLVVGRSRFGVRDEFEQFEPTVSDDKHRYVS